MLTEEQVDKFFKNVLEFPGWKNLKETNRDEFLKQLVQRYQYYCYFNNIEMSSTPPEQRRSPVKEDAIRIGLDGIGGVCFHQNSFMTLLLQALGYNAYISAGKCVGSEVEAEGNHCMCILKFSEEEIYAIDVGCGQAVDEPIPLHKLPYRGRAAGFRYEYIYNETTTNFERWQYDGAFFRGAYEDAGKIQLRYSFSLEPKDFDYFNKTLLEIFTDVEKSIFLKGPFLFRSLDLEGGEDGRRFILIFGTGMVIYDNNNRESTKFESFEELKPHILKYFPKINPALVEKAIGYYNANIEQLQQKE